MSRPSENVDKASDHFPGRINLNIIMPFWNKGNPDKRKV
jgi:hypothetical protein